MKKTFTASILSLLIFFVLGVTMVLAQGPGIVAPTGPGTAGPTGPGTSGPTGPGTSGPTSNIITIPNPFRGGDTLYKLLELVVNEIILPIGGVLAVLAFIYSGFLFVIAQGNETKLGDAKKALLYTSIGTAVLLGSWTLANVIENTIDKLK